MDLPPTIFPLVIDSGNMALEHEIDTFSTNFFMVPGPYKLSEELVFVLVVRVLEASIYVGLVLLLPYRLLAFVATATKTVVTNVLLRQALPPGRLLFGEV